MKCLSCNSENLEIYSKKSELGLEVYYCNKCKFYVNGNSFSEINGKIFKLYLKSYWDKRESENSINLEYSDIESLGKKRNWIVNRI